MRRASLTLVFVLLLAYLLPSVSANTGIPSWFDKKVGEIVAKLHKLEDAGINVTRITLLLDKAVKHAERGDFKKALKILNEVELEVSRLDEKAPIVYTRNLILKGLELALILSTPLVTYMLLPRVYLRLWFSLRKKWLVKVK